MSQKGLRLLREWEGCELMPYKDIAGYWTIGVGHKLTLDELTSGKIHLSPEIIRWHEGITQDQADRLLDWDNNVAEHAVVRNVRVDLTQDQFDALASFTFNSGTAALRSSTLLRLLNAGDYAAVPTQLKRWNKITKWVKRDGKRVAVKTVSKGLVNRRANEIRLWNGER